MIKFGRIERSMLKLGLLISQPGGTSFDFLNYIIIITY